MNHKQPRATAALLTAVTLVALTGCTSNDDKEPTSNPVGSKASETAKAEEDAAKTEVQTILDKYEDKANTAWTDATKPTQKSTALQDALIDFKGPEDSTHYVAITQDTNPVVTLCLSYNGYTEQRVLTYTPDDDDQTNTVIELVDECDTAT